MEKLKMQTESKIDKNIEALGNLFPNTLTEVIKGYDAQDNPIIEQAIDFDLLKQEVSNVVVEGYEERYQMNWPDKKKSMLLANSPIDKTLRPCKDESVDFDNTENLYIEGDNLDVLKLLQETYLNKVKMIYIDPPYNTGKDSFVYNDNFNMDSGDFSDASGQYDEDGNMLFDVRQNNESNGKFHTDWLNMIYPRLKLAKDLLAEDGVIFISIDDNEVDNLKKVCSEIFGESNYIAQIAVQLNPRGRNLDKYIAKTYESIVVYSKNYENRNTMFGVPKEGKMVDEYNKEDEYGKYRATGLRNRNQSFNPITRPNLYYPLYVNPNNRTISLEKNDLYTDEVWPDAPNNIKTCWTWAKTKVKSENELLIAERTGDEWRIYRKDYMLDESGVMATTLIKSLWTDKEINNDYGKKSIKNLFGNSVMDFPKSPNLIKKLIIPSVKKEGIILDFFSGSSTTAHAVIQLNAEDGGNRKFIMVQLPEICDEKSEAYKSGYKTICEIGKERIRRAGAKIKEENADKPESLDTGFRVLKLDSTNMKDVFYKPTELSQIGLDGFTENIKEDRSPEDLLFQVMLELGELLSSDIKEKIIAGKKVFSVGGKNIIACFDTKITNEVVTEIAKLKPSYAVFRDNSMVSDSVATNFEQIFETYSPATVRKVL